MKETLQAFSVQDIRLDQDWVQIFPNGIFLGYDGRGPYELRDAEAVIAASLREKTDLVIDRDHEIMFATPGTHIKAAGWMKQFEARPDGIWAQVEWTPSAQAELTAKEYRYLSPVFGVDSSRRITRILHASLTNNPNLELKAVASADIASVLKKENTMDKNLVAVAAALGLNDPASEEAIVAHSKEFAEKYKSFSDMVEALRTKMGIDAGTDIVATASALVAGNTKPNPADYVPMSAHNELAVKYADLQKSIGHDKAEEAVTAAMKAGKVSPALKDWAMEYASASLEKFNKYIENAPVILLSGAETAASKPAAVIELSETDLAVCKSLGVSPEQYQAARVKQVK